MGNRYFLTGYDKDCPEHPGTTTEWNYSEFFVQYVPSRCSKCIEADRIKRQQRRDLKARSYMALPKKERTKKYWEDKAKEVTFKNVSNALKELDRS